MRKLSRYQQPQPMQSTFDLKTAYDLKSKQMGSSTCFVNKSAIKNPEVELFRLPGINSMRRSASSFTERNTKFKLQSIEQKLQELAADVHNTRLEANETLNHISYLKESLAVQELGQVREDLKKQVKGLERFMKATIASDEDRTRTIKEDCAQLWKQTQQAHQAVFELKMRTQKLEENMGFLNRLRQ